MQPLHAALRRLFFGTCVALFVTSCATTDQRPAPEPGRTTEGVPAPSPAPSDTALRAATNTRSEIVERGTGNFVGPAPAHGRGNGTPGDINLRFDGTDIREFVKVVLGDVLKVNYIVDPTVMGTVTLQTTSPLRNDDVLPFFERVLVANGAALLREGSLYRIVPRAAAARSADLVTGGSPGAGYRTQVIPLQFIAAAEMQRILGSVVADQASLRIDAARNLIVISGTAAEVQAVQDTIAVFDVDWLRGMSLGLYPLRNVSPATLEGELRRVLSATAGQTDAGGGSVLDGIVRLVPLERLTSLLVVSSTAAGLREVEAWIRRLDQPAESAGQRLYVYPVQNAKASELAEILGAIFQSRTAVRNTDSSSNGSRALSGASRRSTSGIGAVAPTFAPVQIRPPAPSSTPAPPAPRSANTFATGNELASDPLAISDGGSLQIIADDLRNSLVILAAPEQYKMIESAVRQLDVVPLQVMIEARILEVALHNDLSYGVEWFFKNNHLNGDGHGQGTLDSGPPGIAALAPGFAYTVIDSADRVQFALNLLATESDVNVLSSPTLMVLDNQTATINVGDEIPVPSRQSISTIGADSPTVNEITFRQTGITLSVTPRVSSSGLVTMEIQQQVSTAGTTTTSSIDAPTIQNRQIDSVVAINSGETIVLGGLMQKQASTSGSGVPGLRKIPFIGKLFGQTSNNKSRTELLVLITPRVVRNREDVRSITDEFRRKLPQLQKLEAESAAEPHS
jgi:general secretion pathway protein D